MESKFSREFVEEYDRRKAKEEAEKEARIEAYKITNPPPRVVIPEITSEKYGMEYPDMRAFVFKVILGATAASIAFFSALYYFSHH